MTESQVINNIKTLAQSQGFYGRLLESLDKAKNSDDEEVVDSYHEFIDSFKDCHDIVDMVLRIEG